MTPVFPLHVNCIPFTSKLSSPTILVVGQTPLRAFIIIIIYYCYYYYVVLSIFHHLPKLVIPLHLMDVTQKRSMKAEGLGAGYDGKYFYSNATKMGDIVSIPPFVTLTNICKSQLATRGRTRGLWHLDHEFVCHLDLMMTIVEIAMGSTLEISGSYQWRRGQESGRYYFY